MGYYVKKPVIVQATQWNKPGDHPMVAEMSDGNYAIETKEGWMVVRPGSWVITGIEGEHYAVDQRIFEKTYDCVDNLVPDLVDLGLKI